MDCTQALVHFVLDTLDCWMGGGEFWNHDNIEIRYYDKDDISRAYYIIEDKVDMEKFYQAMDILGIKIF